MPCHRAISLSQVAGRGEGGTQGSHPFTCHAPSSVEEDESYLHYEFTSLLLRFVDDVEFLFDDETKTIHFRSASRTGYGDLRLSIARAWSRCVLLVEEKL